MQIKKDQSKFREKLKVYIREKGLTQAFIAKELGIGQDFLSRLINEGNKNKVFPYDYLGKICKILELDQDQTDELFALAGYETHSKTQDAVDNRPKKPFIRPGRIVPFIGREEKLAKLLDELHPGRVIAICGPGGIGKTSLAVEAIWRLAPTDKLPERFPDGVIFYSFYGHPQTELAFQQIALEYGEVIKPSPRDAAQRALAGRRALLILDGAEEADDLQSILDIRDCCAVLITSRPRFLANIE